MQKLGMSLIAGFAGALAFGALACDDGAVDKGENAILCRNMCGNVDRCLDWSDEREESCREQCNDNSTKDSFESQVEECQQCLDKDKSCVENAVDCATECATVVPISAS